MSSETAIRFRDVTEETEIEKPIVAVSMRRACRDVTKSSTCVYEHNYRDFLQTCLMEEIVH